MLPEVMPAPVRLIPDVLRVIEIDQTADDRWEGFVHAHPHALIYHHGAWIQTLEREYDRRALRLVCEDSEGNVRGVLALMPTRGLPFVRGGHLFGRRHASLPRTPVAGPLAMDEQAYTMLMEAAIARVQKDNGARLQIKAASAGLNELVDDLSEQVWRVAYVLNLPEQPADIRFGNGRNHNRIKWAVNKASRAGVVVRTAETEADLRAWYALYVDTMRWHAIPARSYRFFKTTWDLLRPRGFMRLLLAEQHGEGKPTLLAGSIFLMFGHTVFYAFNGRRKESLGLRPNDVIQWHAIHDACAAGYRHFDFGEVADDNEGLAGFKSKWGATPYDLHRYYYPAPSVARSGTPSTKRSVELAKAAWRRVPLKVTTVLGDWVYSYL